MGRLPRSPTNTIIHELITDAIAVLQIDGSARENIADPQDLNSATKCSYN
jgi:hypothetical protein